MSPRQIAILAVLCSSADPLSTTDVRQRVNTTRDEHSPVLVAERVYRCLLALQRRGLVVRVPADVDRVAMWQSATATAGLDQSPQRRNDAS